MVAGERDPVEAALIESIAAIRGSLDQYAANTDDMLATLSRFEEKINHLDKSIRPVNNLTDDIALAHQNIGKSLAQFERIQLHFRTAQDCSPLLSNSSALKDESTREKYFAATARVCESFDFLKSNDDLVSAEAALSTLGKVREFAIEALCELFMNTLAEHAACASDYIPDSVDLGSGWAEAGSRTVPELQTALGKVVKRHESLPASSTVLLRKIASCVGRCGLISIFAHCYSLARGAVVCHVLEEFSQRHWGVQINDSLTSNYIDLQDDDVVSVGSTASASSLKPGDAASPPPVLSAAIAATVSKSTPSSMPAAPNTPNSSAAAKSVPPSASDIRLLDFAENGGSGSGSISKRSTSSGSLSNIASGKKPSRFSRIKSKLRRSRSRRSSAASEHSEHTVGSGVNLSSNSTASMVVPPSPPLPSSVTSRAPSEDSAAIPSLGSNEPSRVQKVKKSSFASGIISRVREREVSRSRSRSRSREIPDSIARAQYKSGNHGMLLLLPLIVGVMESECALAAAVLPPGRAGRQMFLQGMGNAIQALNTVAVSVAIPKTRKQFAETGHPFAAMEVVVATRVARPKFEKLLSVEQSNALQRLGPAKKSKSTRAADALGEPEDTGVKAWEQVQETLDTWGAEAWRSLRSAREVLTRPIEELPVTANVHPAVTLLIAFCKRLAADLRVPQVVLFAGEKRDGIASEEKEAAVVSFLEDLVRDGFAAIKSINHNLRSFSSLFKLNNAVHMLKHFAADEGCAAAFGESSNVLTALEEERDALKLEYLENIVTALRVLLSSNQPERVQLPPPKRDIELQELGAVPSDLPSGARKELKEYAKRLNTVIEMIHKENAPLEVPDFELRTELRFRIRRALVPLYETKYDQLVQLAPFLVQENWLAYSPEVFSSMISQFFEASETVSDPKAITIDPMQEPFMPSPKVGRVSRKTLR